MKILIIQENGRHEISKHLRECNSMQRALLTCDVECDVWGLGHSNFTDTINFNNYDVIINLENYDTGWVPDLSNIKSPIKLLWAIDSHVRGQTYYNHIFTEGKYNYILQATKNFLNKDSVWLPNCYDDDYIKPVNVAKKTLLGFCGSIQNRGTLFNYINKSIPLKLDVNVRGIDMINAINSYKISLNANISVDINYRNFETAGTGTLLLTNFNDQYEELGFKSNLNCLIYKTPDEAIDIINAIKTDEKTISDISLAGYELVRTKHTFKNRARSLVKFLNTIN